MNEWIETKAELPPQDVIVDTKIDDIDGMRNQQRLYRKKGLWFIPESRIYVYYRPTHWRYIND